MAAHTHTGGGELQALVDRARAALARGDVAAALLSYENAAQQAKEKRLRALIYVELGALYEEHLGRLDRALERYEQAFKIDPDAPRAIESGRRLYRALGDWPRVARLYEVELETATPDGERRARLLVELGRLSAERLRDLVGAALRFEEAVKLRPSDEPAKELLADVYLSPDFPESGSSGPSERAARLLAELALLRRARGDEPGEIAYLRRALGADPYMVDAAVRLEELSRKGGRTDELKQLYRDAPLPDRPLKRAILSLELNELDDAAEAIVEAVEEGLAATAAERRLEAVWSEKKEWAKLAAFSERLVDALGPDVERLLHIAKWQQQAGAPLKAEEAFARALSLDAAHAEALKGYGDAVSARRDYPSLASAWEAAIEAVSGEAQVKLLVELAEIYEKKVGDVPAAADAWRRAEAIAPSERGTQELKRLHQKDDRFAALTQSLEKELQKAVEPQARAEVLRRLAQVHRDRCLLDRARELFEESLKIKPDDAPTYRALADLAERQGRPDLLAMTLKRQLSVSKEKVERLNILRRLAVLYDERLDDRDELLWAATEILNTLPGDRDSLRRLEQAYERGGEDCEEQLSGVLEKHAQAAATPAEKLPLLHRLAALHEKRGDAAGAAERWERALKLDKHDAIAHEALARLYETLGRHADAAMAWERALLKDDKHAAKWVEAWRRFARVLDGKVHDPARATKAWREVLERRHSDREALEALSRLYAAKSDWKPLVDILARREKLAEGDDAAALSLERARVLDEQLRDRAGAISVLRELIDGRAPRHLAAHELLRKLERAAGDIAASQRTAERELFLTEESAPRRALSIEIARAWSEKKDLQRAIAAWERVVELEPEGDATPELHESLASLAELYGEASEPEKQVAVDEQRLELALAAADKQQAIGILFELGLTAEGDLHDAKRAFGYFRRAQELDTESGTLNELRRVAESHNLWEDLCAVYAAMPGVSARLSVAEIADERLNDPKRAFAVVRGALDLDPTGERVLPELERLSLRADDARGLNEVYATLLERRESKAQKIELYRKRADVLEHRLQNASGALDEMERAFAVDPDDPSILAEVHRLAEATARWEDALTIEGFRFHRAPPEQKLAIALEAAALVEEKVKDLLRAFRAYLRALQLAPDDERIRDHLWRLARLVGTIDESAAPPKKAPPPKPRPTLGAISNKPPRRDQTMEIDLDDLSDVVVEEPRRDPTVELSIQDLVTIQKTGPIPLLDPEPKGPPPPPPPQPRAVVGAHSAWDELASVMMTLPAPDAATRFRRLCAVAEMWEKGAGDLGHAFDTLASAFLLDPDSADARGALERLADANQAWDRLVGVLDLAIEKTGSPERAVKLLIDSASVRMREGKLDDAEERYQRALGIQPASEEAQAALEQLYRRAERWNELATLLERRLTGLFEKLPPGEERRQRALELAEVYQRVGNTYEAISAWQRVADENPEHAPAFSALAHLYESVAQWSKVIEALTRELDLVEAAGDAKDRARALRRRVAEIFERELEVPERAAEAYAALQESAPGDGDVEAALERLYERLGRFGDLEALWRRQTERWGDPGKRGALLERRATLLEEKLKDDAGAAAVLKQLRALRPDDDEVAEWLAQSHGRAGAKKEQAEVVKQRIAKRKDKSPERARLLVELATIESELGDSAAAQKTLERALAEAADDPHVIAEVARLREGGSDWDGYAAAREREAEVATGKDQAVHALLDSARVHRERRNDAAAALRCLERALGLQPDSLEVLRQLAPLYRALEDHDRADDAHRKELALLGDDPERKAQLHAVLGRSHLRKSELEPAEREFRAALAASPGQPAAVLGLAEVAAALEHWDEVESLLRDAAARESSDDEGVAIFHTRLAAAFERQGRSEDAYLQLLDAMRRSPNSLSLRRLVGENRYRANRFREAAQYLGQVAEHPGAEAELGREMADSAYHAAIAETKLRRNERVTPLLEIAVRIDPHHVDALGLLAERILEAGEVPRALDLFERQALATVGAAERATRFMRLGEVVLSELKDEARALQAFEHALQSGGAASTEILEKMVELEQRSGNLERASALAAQLIDRAATNPERARRLRETASLEAALGNTDSAVARLRTALELDALDPETLAGLSALLAQRGADDEAAQLLTRALPMLPPPANEPIARAARAVLWTRLGECRERKRDLKGTFVAFEKALEADPSRRPLRELLLQRYGDDPAHDAEVRAHHLVILAEEPLHAPSLRALHRIDARQKKPDGGRRFVELLAVAGTITDEERRRLGEDRPPEPDPDAIGTLDESDHVILAHPDALGMGPMLAALWEGAGNTAPDLASLGVRPDLRISPVGGGDLSTAYAMVSRALGNRRTGLYLKPDAPPDFLQVIAHPPTAVVVSPAIVEGRPLADVRFLLGRALEIARPEYVLSAALPSDEFARLFGAILRAFHPRHARRAAGADDEAAEWRKKLPYKAAKRLSELFHEMGDTTFSSVNWRQAVRHTGNRAGLVAAGDPVAAARVLLAENDREGVVELARFCVSDRYTTLRDKLVRK